jgi:hypothetical protein
MGFDRATARNGNHGPPGRVAADETCQDEEDSEGGQELLGRAPAHEAGQLVDRDVQEFHPLRKTARQEEAPDA